MRDGIKEFLIDLALMTKDFDWIEEIKAKNFDSVPHSEVEESDNQFTSLINLNHSTETLAEIYNSLNHFKWNNYLGKKPVGFDSLPDYKADANQITKHDHISPIISEIERSIGRKECLRWHHINNLNRTNEEFEAWWVANGSVDI